MIDFRGASAVTLALRNMRERLDLPEAVFVLSKVRRVPIRSDDLIPAKQVVELFHPSGLLIRDGRPVFAYIRDHTKLLSRMESDGFHKIHDPKQLYKLHMAACTWLKEMKSSARFHRYVITESIDGRREIDTPTGVKRVRLNPCQFCLGKIRYRDFDRDTMTRTELDRIVITFTAEEAMSLLNDIYEQWKKRNDKMVG